jgi:hypothetical protein
MSIAIATSAIKDRPSTWGSSLEPPPSFNVSEYQSKLTQIGGTTQQGEPVLRIVWGGSESKFKAVEFDTFGNPTDWARVPRYAFESKKIETWAQLIPIRRWIIEENTDAGQLEALGGKNHGNIQYKEKGLYTPYIIVADHSKCGECKASEFKCFGDYKHPGNEELLFLTEVTYKLTTSRKQDPRKNLDMDLVANIVKSETPDKEEQQALEEIEERKFVRNWLDTHLPIRIDQGYANTNSNSKPASKV